VDGAGARVDGIEPLGPPAVQQRYAPAALADLRFIEEAEQSEHLWIFRDPIAFKASVNVFEALGARPDGTRDWLQADLASSVRGRTLARAAAGGSSRSAADRPLRGLRSRPDGRARFDLRGSHVVADVSAGASGSPVRAFYVLVLTVETKRTVPSPRAGKGSPP
jgi:hypothetical protein